MNREVRHTLKLLRIEFEDLIDDLRTLEQVGMQRYQRAEITEYVLKENNALFEEEIRAIRSMQVLLDEGHWENAENPQGVFDSIDRQVRAYISDRQFPVAVYEIVSRKMKKVRDYCLS